MSRYLAEVKVAAERVVCALRSKNFGVLNIRFHHLAFT